MFRWYSRAAVCYAYLADVPNGDELRLPGSKFQSSRWFSRGWTLQELLAPERMQFFDQNWACIGTKGQLSASLSLTTGIPRRFLLGLSDISNASVAQRMSWASKRQTKRPEDIAYCLLGIFDVYMPLIYGEGGRHAFFRLQEHICRQTRDDSILAWGVVSDIVTANDFAMNETLESVTYGKVLAESPADFLSSGGIGKGDCGGPGIGLQVFGDGIRADIALDQYAGHCLAILRCYSESDRRFKIGVPLIAAVGTDSRVLPNEYIRPHGRPAILYKQPKAPLPTRFVQIRNEKAARHVSQDDGQTYWFLIEGDDSAFGDIEALPSNSWDADRSLARITASDNDGSGILRFCSKHVGQPDLIAKIATQVISEPRLLNADPQCFLMRASSENDLATIARTVATIPTERLQSQVMIGDWHYVAEIIPAGEEASLPNLYILNLTAKTSGQPQCSSLDLDTEMSKCFARRRVGVEKPNEHDAEQRPTRRRLLNILCPIEACHSIGTRQWLCNICYAPLEHGFIDEFIYCDCGRYPCTELEFKCNSGQHGPDFQAYRAAALRQSLQLLDNTNCTNILILGETGVGKSTFINAFANYLVHPTLDDAIIADELHYVVPTVFQVQNIESDETTKERTIKEHTILVGESSADEMNGYKGVSATVAVTVHVFTVANRVIRLFDTPGFGDTRGVEFDRRNIGEIVRTLSGYDMLHGVLILVKSNAARLATPFSRMLTEIATLLPVEAAGNVMFGFTVTRVSNYTPGDSLRPLLELWSRFLSGTPFRHQFQLADGQLPPEAMYCFDSEGFRYLAAVKQGVKLGSIGDFRRSWEVSRSEIRRLLSRCRELPPLEAEGIVSFHKARWLCDNLTSSWVDISNSVQLSKEINQNEYHELPKRPDSQWFKQKREGFVELGPQLARAFAERALQEDRELAQLVSVMHQLRDWIKHATIVPCQDPVVYSSYQEQDTANLLGGSGAHELEDVSRLQPLSTWAEISSLVASLRQLPHFGDWFSYLTTVTAAIETSSDWERLHGWRAVGGVYHID